MSTMTEVFCGVDTHADTHTAAVINGIGRVLATETFPVTANGYNELTAWITSFGRVVLVGVEGTGSYGAGLTRHLMTAELDVREVNRTNRQHRRRHGKSDPADAIAAAKAVASGEAQGLPRCVDGPVEAVRNLATTRSGLVKARTQTANQIHALIKTAPQPLREQLHAKTLPQIANTVAELEASDITDPTGAVITCLQALTQTWTALGTHIKNLTKALETATAAAAHPDLFDQVGIGATVAADLITVAGSDPNRFTSEAGFAAACGVSPVDASSGQQQRHRLNRGGDRQANAALYRIVIVRLRYHQPTKDYMARRLAEGKTKREIIRCLKRYVARDVYRILTQPH
ncbi:MAG: IS110 family transposase [Acidimicrobiia bacterium]